MASNPPGPRILVRRNAETFIPHTLRDLTGEFLAGEAASGILLLVASLIAIVWVNAPGGGHYESLWTTPITADLGVVKIAEDLRHLVNDGLMTLFFLVVGLEIKRELRHGELTTLRNATLPAVAAIGGMVLPALLYAALNAGGEGSRGWGVPMATDIAFAVGVLSLLGRRVPMSAKVFLLSLAVVDDLGAIVVIAIFYSHGITFAYLAASAGLVLLIAAMNVRGVRSVAWYVIVGVPAWVALQQSGVHPAIIGATLGLLTPALPFYAPEGIDTAVARLTQELTLQISVNGDTGSVFSQIEDVASASQSPLDRLERAMLPWANYLVLPLFGLANAGVDLSPDRVGDALASHILHGIVLGLVMGKMLGILGASYLAVRLHLCDLPYGLNWRHIAGIGVLGGIGFTVSLLISDAAFLDANLLTDARIAILAGSTLAGIAGYVWLRFVAAVKSP